MFVVLLEPLVGTERIGSVLEVLAVLVILALELHATLIVDKVNEAVLGLVLIGETRVELGCPERLAAKVLAQTFGDAGRKHFCPSVHHLIVVTSLFLSYLKKDKNYLDKTIKKFFEFSLKFIEKKELNLKKSVKGIKKANKAMSVSEN